MNTKIIIESPNRTFERKSGHFYIDTDGEMFENSHIVKIRDATFAIVHHNREKSIYLTQSISIDEIKERRERRFDIDSGYEFIRESFCERILRDLNSIAENNIGYVYPEKLPDFSFRYIIGLYDRGYEKDVRLYLAKKRIKFVIV